MHLWVERIKDCSNEEPFDSHKVDDMFFLLLPGNQCDDLINSYVVIDLNCFLGVSLMIMQVQLPQHVQPLDW